MERVIRCCVSDLEAYGLRVLLRGLLSRSLVYVSCLVYVGICFLLRFSISNPVTGMCGAWLQGWVCD